MQTERTLEQMNAAQKKTIEDLTAEVKKLKVEVKENAIWSRFAGYLLDHCEGQTIYEESLQHWMADMLEAEKTQSPVKR